MAVTQARCPGRAREDKMGTRWKGCDMSQARCCNRGASPESLGLLLRGDVRYQPAENTSALEEGWSLPVWLPSHLPLALGWMN